MVDKGERLTLEEIQKVSLSILSDVHEFCINNDIKYSLAYGTLLGAIRHKGFIPWDDDVDIVMPRKDFERFCNLYKSEKGYKILSPDSSESLIPFGRVYDTRSTRCSTTAPWSTFETGVWIDVFPLDGVEDNYDDFKARIQSLRNTAKKIAMTRTSSEGFLHTKTLRRKCTWIVKKIYTFGTNIKQLKSSYLQDIQRLEFDKSNYFGQLSCYDEATHKEHNPKEDFQNCVEVEFEGKKMLAMNGYDRVLKRYYGDYMQLPPKGQQVPKINSYIDFFWK